MSMWDAFSDSNGSSASEARIAVSAINMLISSVEFLLRL